MSRILSVTIRLACLAFSFPAMAQCPQWSNEFSSAGCDGDVRAQLVLPGGVERLLGGDFQWVGDVNAPYLAHFDGAVWSALGNGPPGPVYSVAMYDNGTSNLLYAGGRNFLASWDGTAWTFVAVGGSVFALHAHDDGAGPALFVGGQFLSIDGIPLIDLGRLRAGVWDNLNGAGSVGGRVRSLATHDDGSGPALYVGGVFEEIGGVAANRLARWDGAVFSQVGGGLSGAGGSQPVVRALISAVGPGGVPELHAGGNFRSAGGVPSSSWVIWRQGSWVDVGGTEPVFQFALRDVPGGTTVCAARGQGVDCYDGVGLTRLPLATQSSTWSLSAYGPSPQELSLGTAEPHESGSHLGRWNGTEWAPFFEGPGRGLGLSKSPALGVHDFGGGNELVAVASTPGPRASGPVIRYDGSQWWPVTGAGLEQVSARSVESLGGVLHLIGQIEPEGYPGPGPSYAAARLVPGPLGPEWEPLGGRFSSTAGSTAVLFDSGSGPELVIGGITHFGAPGTQGIARLSGSNWTTLGGGVTGSNGPGYVFRLVTWDDGSGPALYAAGDFTEMGGVVCNGVARWDGTSWSSLGTGTASSTSLTAPVWDMTVFDGPAGETLVIAGSFDSVDGVVANGLAAWDGSSWSAVGGSLSAGGTASELFAYDPDGFGERLWVLGGFLSVGGLAVEGAAVWDGTTWSDSELPGFNGSGSLVSFDDGEGRALFAATSSDTVAGVPCQGIAKYEDPCGATLGQPRCTSSLNSSGARALLRARGSASVSAMDLTLEARRLPANATTLFFAGTGPLSGAAGNGFRCVGGALRRVMPLGNSGGNGTVTQAFDLQAPYATHVAIGQSIWIQGFFRDPSAGGAGFDTTDALEIQIRP